MAEIIDLAERRTAKAHPGSLAAFLQMTEEEQRRDLSRRILKIADILGIDVEAPFRPKPRQETPGPPA